MKFITQAAKALNEQKKHKRRLAVFLCLAVVVALGTAAALKMYGQAMSHKQKKLACRAEVHQHTDECYNGDEPACGYADYAVHVHNDDCYETDGAEKVLACRLPETEAHVHTEECCSEQKVLVCGEEESQAHEHTESCYARERGELACPLEEHVHGEECRDENGELACQLEEHQHNDDCYEWEDVLTCRLEESAGGHIHGEECYEMQKVFTCGQLELHSHDESCYDENGALTCGLLELKEHVHGEECFEIVELSGEEVMALSDTEESASENDAPVHIHNKDCYDENGNLICELGGKEPGHLKYYEGDGYIITAAYNDDANIPEEAELIAEQITAESDSKRFAQREKEIQQTLDEEINVMAALFEIGFYVDGSEVEPENPVSVTIQFLDENGLPEGTPVKVVHFADKGTEVLEGSEMDDRGATTFKMDSFSEIGVVPGIQKNDDGSYQLIDYLTKKEGAEYEIKLIDENGFPLPVDGNGKVIVQAGVNYQMRFVINAEMGLDAGTYVYQLPTENIQLKEGGEKGSLLIGGTDVGEWSVDSESGKVTFILRDNIKDYTNITLACSFFIKFKATEGDITLPDGLKVSIEVDKGKSHISKWEYLRGGEDVARGSEKIEWMSQIEVKGTDKIIGATLTDSIETPYTTFTEQDRAKGVRFVALDPASTTKGTYGDWGSYDHTWVVDEELVYFNETGWKYVMPERITCDLCNEEVALSDSWQYFTVCTSTIPDEIVQNGGAAINRNRIELENKENVVNGVPQESVIAHGDSKHTFGSEGADIFKDVEYDADAKTITWDIDVSIPAASFFGEKFEETFIEDKMFFARYNSDNECIRQGAEGIIYNELDNAVVTVSGNNSPPLKIAKAVLEEDKTYKIDNTDADPDLLWTVGKPEIDDTRAPGESRAIMYFANPCRCNENNCEYWTTYKGRNLCGKLQPTKIIGTYAECERKYKELQEEGFAEAAWAEEIGGGFWKLVFYKYCTCWQCSQNVKLNIRYETHEAYSAEEEQTLQCGSADPDHKHTGDCYIQYSEDKRDIFEAYGGKNCEVDNEVKLVRTQPVELESTWIILGSDRESVTLPGMFEKKLEQQPRKENGWTARYSITINEALRDLSKSEDGTITYDNVELTDKMSDTLALNVASLEIEATTNGTTKRLEPKTDYTLEYTKPTLRIKLLHPGPTKYVIKYSATVVADAGSADLSYSNQAEITMQGKKYTDDTGVRDALGAYISGDSYKVQLMKKGEGGESLAGAEFKLCTADGTPLVNGIKTDSDGKAYVKTDTTNGIYLSDHTLYYFEETKAPEGYLLDTTKHWFIFCKSQSKGCEGYESAFKEQTESVCKDLGLQTEKEIEAFRQSVNRLSGQEEKDGSKDQPLEVVNKAEYQLPETGGIGDRLVYIAAFMIAAASSLLGYRQMKRRKIKTLF